MRFPDGSTYVRASGWCVVKRLRQSDIASDDFPMDPLEVPTCVCASGWCCRFGDLFVALTTTTYDVFCFQVFLVRNGFRLCSASTGAMLPLVIGMNAHNILQLLPLPSAVFQI